MNSHDQAVQELIEEGFWLENAEYIVSQEEEGLIIDLDTGEELDVDPDAPIVYEVTPAGVEAAVS